MNDLAMLIQAAYRRPLSSIPLSEILAAIGEHYTPLELLERLAEDRPQALLSLLRSESNPPPAVESVSLVHRLHSHAEGTPSHSVYLHSVVRHLCRYTGQQTQPIELSAGQAGALVMAIVVEVGWQIAYLNQTFEHEPGFKAACGALALAVTHAIVASLYAYPLPKGQNVTQVTNAGRLLVALREEGKQVLRDAAPFASFDDYVAIYARLQAELDEEVEAYCQNMLKLLRKGVPAGCMRASLLIAACLYNGDLTENEQADLLGFLLPAFSEAEAMLVINHIHHSPEGEEPPKQYAVIVRRLAHELAAILR